MSSERIYQHIPGNWIGIDSMEDFSALLPDWFPVNEISVPTGGVSFEEAFVPTNKPNTYKAVGTNLEYLVFFDSAGNVSRLTLVAE